MLNNPNEWHNIEDEENEQQEIPVETQVSTNTTNSNKVKITAVIALFVVISAVAVAVTIVNKTKSATETIPTYEQNQDLVGANTGDNSFGDQNTETVEIPIDVPVDSTQANMQNKPIDQLNKDGSVLVAVGGEGRENPFVPYINAVSAVASSGYSSAYGGGAYRGGYGIPFEVIEPPEKMVRDVRAESLMTTTVSGILYDSKNPSAIINYKGEDQMVRKGDKLSNFTILDITKSKVVVKSGSNIYIASVGQALQDESNVNVNEVYNLQRKFGGAYASEVPRGILIKPTIRPN